MRTIISDILNSSEDIEVACTARNGIDAIEKIKTLDVDVVTMDIEMPEMDGITALKKIMEENPLPVVMISMYTKTGAEETLKSLSHGAVDFIPKPGGSISLGIKELSNEIIAKVITASRVSIRKIKELRTGAVKTPEVKAMTIDWIESKPLSVPKKSIFATKRLVVIGSSTGGPQTLEHIIPKLPKNLPAPVLVVQHMPPGFTTSFANRLNKMSSLEVREAKDGDLVEKGVALLAPGDYHMEIDHTTVEGIGAGIVRLNQNPREQGVRPCINVTMKSVAEVYGKMTVGVVLTGMGSDGTEGFRAIKAMKGATISQDEESCIVYGMPKAVVDAGVVDYVVQLEEIADKIVECLKII